LSEFRGQAFGFQFVRQGSIAGRQVVFRHTSRLDVPLERTQSVGFVDQICRFGVFIVSLNFEVGDLLAGLHQLSGLSGIGIAAGGIFLLFQLLFRVADLSIQAADLSSVGAHVPDKTGDLCIDVL